MQKYSVLIAHRHTTSISLEPEFYQELLHIAKIQEISRNDLITYIDKTRSTENLSSAIRLYVLNFYKESSPK